ncbi:hypothetical protein PHJA_002976200 [Phtheirospermum japonicum]|uniref:RPW8 domain-containing protein n=1 Tax=Phtheirospermum japonicum TaxID=374723 RepID=A0A830DRM8_9LAMI|nr:hypothetical protein PHJA_002976200 [Phtheirospermum japonicum]
MMQTASTKSWTGGPHQETHAFVARLVEGEKLVHKCSKVRCWNVIMRLYYSMKLSRLEAELVSFFQINLAAIHFRESLRVSAAVSNLEGKMNEIITMLNTNDCCSRNVAAPDCGEDWRFLDRFKYLQIEPMDIF